MHDIPASSLITLSLSLAAHYADSAKFEQFLSALRSVIHCDAIALLTLNAPISAGEPWPESTSLTPKSLQGLSRDTLGRRFVVNEHPRFVQLLQQDSAYRFAHDCGLPDPYDGLLLDSAAVLPIHACMGIPLRKNDQTFALVTFDSMQVDAFSSISERSLQLLAEIASHHCHNLFLLEQSVQDAQHSQQLVATLSQRDTWSDTHEMIGESRAMQKLKHDIQLIAASDFSVLIQGETGTGKELVAQQLHEHSTRKQAPMIYVNCAALPENLIESELFGHAKGAFTGAQNQRAGKFQLAHKGTIFLDEIGELPLSAQSKLLRVLQNQEIQPVGQDSTVVVDVRVIAATNRNLAEEVENGAFRRDLFHRLNIYPVYVPTLKERQGDIALLCGFFIERLRRKLGVVQLVVAQSLIHQFDSYHWPGNVREFEHLLTRAALKAKARCSSERIVVTADDIDIRLSTQALHSTENIQSQTGIEPLNLREAVDNFQKQLVKNALIHYQGNWTKTAKHFSIDRGNLNRLAKRLGIFVEKSIKQSK